MAGALSGVSRAALREAARQGAKVAAEDAAPGLFRSIGRFLFWGGPIRKLATTGAALVAADKLSGGRSTDLLVTGVEKVGKKVGETVLPAAFDAASNAGGHVLDAATNKFQKWWENFDLGDFMTKNWGKTAIGTLALGIFSGEGLIRNLSLMAAGACLIFGLTRATPAFTSAANPGTGPSTAMTMKSTIGPATTTTTPPVEHNDHLQSGPG